MQRLFIIPKEVTHVVPLESMAIGLKLDVYLSLKLKLKKLKSIKDSYAYPYAFPTSGSTERNQ